MLNKEVYINRRKKLKENFRDGLILIMGNNFSPLDCEDNTYPFIQDATFKYYFGMDHNGLIGIIDIDNNEEIIFGNDYTMSDIIWMGKQKFLKELALEVGIEKFIEKEELKKYLENRKNIRFTNQYKADNIMYLSSILNINPFEFNEYVSFYLIKNIIKQRNIKDKLEIEEIEKGVNITKEMHLAAMKNVKAGMKEYELVAEVEKQPRKYNAYYSFQTILSKNGQILHNHNHLNTLKDGDLVLLDCGALTEEGYCGDMTTTFPVSGKFTERQKTIHNIVRDMFDRAKDLARAGITYKEVHLEACKVLAENMKKLGLMRGEVEDIVSSGAHALFMPHGLGHMMGMTVHDMENFGEINVGYDEGEEKLFEKWKNEKLHQEFLNYDEIEKYMDFGGIRMERDILIQEDGTSRILGDKFPRTADEIEEYMENKNR